MITIPFGKIAILIALLVILLIFFFFWMRRMKKKKREKEIKKLEEEFGKNRELKEKETPKEDKDLLEKITKEIENAAKEKKKTVEIELEEGNSLRIEAPDVIALITPRITLHKSFTEVRFQKIDKTDNIFKLSIK